MLLCNDSNLFLSFFRQRGFQISSVVIIFKILSKRVVLLEVRRQNKPRLSETTLTSVLIHIIVKTLCFGLKQCSFKFLNKHLKILSCSKNITVFKGRKCGLCCYYSSSIRLWILLLLEVFLEISAQLSISCEGSNHQNFREEWLCIGMQNSTLSCTHTTYIHKLIC